MTRIAKTQKVFKINKTKDLPKSTKLHDMTFSTIVTRIPETSVYLFFTPCSMEASSAFASIVFEFNNMTDTVIHTWLAQADITLGGQ